jgi:hypothetical protein
LSRGIARCYPECGNQRNPPGVVAILIIFSVISITILPITAFFFYWDIDVVTELFVMIVFRLSGDVFWIGTVRLVDFDDGDGTLRFIDLFHSSLLSYSV